jgi:hypothetical protein
MPSSKRLLTLLVAAFVAASNPASAFDVSRSAVETGFLKAAHGTATNLACVVMPHNRAIEICAFQAGEAVAISFLFDSGTKAFRGTSVFFAEKETDLGVRMGKAALAYSGYAGAEAVDFKRLMKSATLAGHEVKLPGAAASARKTPPNLYILAFAPTAD